MSKKQDFSSFENDLRGKTNVELTDELTALECKKSSWILN